MRERSSASACSCRAGNAAKRCRIAARSRRELAGCASRRWISSGVRYGSVASTFMPKARASRATRRPMCPMPTRPTVLPRSSCPMTSSREKPRSRRRRRSDSADPARHVDHQTERELGDRVGIAAGLVHHGDAGLRAGGDIRRVVARTPGGYAQEVGASFQQLAVDEEPARQLVLGRRHVKDVCVRQQGHALFDGACRGAHVQVETGLGAQALVEHGIDPKIETDDFHAGGGHRLARVRLWKTHRSDRRHKRKSIYN